MPEPPVVNASPLVVLARAGRLDLLRLLGDRVFVPEAVAAEIRGHSDEAARALDAEGWIEEVPDTPRPRGSLQPGTLAAVSRQCFRGRLLIRVRWP